MEKNIEQLKRDLSQKSIQLDNIAVTQRKEKVR